MVQTSPPTPQDIVRARAAIDSHVFRTPLRVSRAISTLTGCRVFLKLENWQPTGSFKVRGAVNFLSQLSPAEVERGLVTASAGNHGLAVAYAADRLQIPNVTVFVPNTAPHAKVEKVGLYPVTLVKTGETYGEAHRAAEDFAEERGATIVHAYDDSRTIAGAGTIGYEILEDLPETEAVLVPVGGGGLISGIALAVKASSPGIKVYGVQPDASPALRDSLRDGRPYEDYPAGATICDGLAGGIGTNVFRLAQGGLIDGVLVVTEEAVHRAVAAFVRDEQIIVEGAGAVGLAAVQELAANFKGRRLVLVVTGANIDSDRLASIVAKWG